MIHKIFQIAAMICLLSFTAVQAQLKVGDEAPEIVITDWIKNVPASKDYLFAILSLIAPVGHQFA